MKIQTLLGLCLSGSLLFAGSAAMADDDKSNKSNNRSARAVQVHIDKEGRKTAPDDSREVAEAAPTTQSSNASMIMPSENQAPQVHSNGSVTMQLGQESMKYLVLTVGEDGQMTMTHQSPDNIGKQIEAQESEKGDK